MNTQSTYVPPDSKEDIFRALGKEFRINPNVTIEKALREIFEDLDCDLVASSSEEAMLSNSPRLARWAPTNPVLILRENLENMGLYKQREKLVKNVIPKKYLSIF